MSGGADAIAGAVERMYRKLHAADRAGARRCFMSGGAAPKLAPITDLPFETVETADLRRPAAPAVEATGALKEMSWRRSSR